MACKVAGQRINLLTAYFLIQVGSEENESLSVWTPFFRGGDEMVKWSNTLSCGEAIGAVPGSNPQNVLYFIYTGYSNLKFMCVI